MDKIIDHRIDMKGNVVVADLGQRISILSEAAATAILHFDAAHAASLRLEAFERPLHCQCFMGHSVRTNIGQSSCRLTQATKIAKWSAPSRCSWCRMTPLFESSGGFRHQFLLILYQYLMLFFKFLTACSPQVGSTMFKNVCLGGTFDGIHAGHKLLFAEATKICSKRLVVGVTDDQMIKRKKLWELIMPVEQRIKNVRECLQEMNPNLTYQIVPISDLYGPTITDEELECIVVSEETVKGANKINAARVAKGWPELKVHSVNLLQDSNSSNQETLSRINENKVSSSLFRVQKLGTIFRPPEPNNSIPKRPYLIGLTGGIASGKTTIGKYLESLGFGYINYDLLGHKTYEKIGSPVYKQIVEKFGYSVLNESTNLIDRAKLGKVVFSDREKLEALNKIVWPGIFALADKEIEKLKVKHDVIILECALLVEAGQTKRVHQVWTSIIPPEEAIKRQMESRGESREAAEKRVNSQTDNITRVRSSNAVFCTLWEQEFTQQQVNRAVAELKEKYL